MTKQIDVAETLEADADKLPDLVFTRRGELVTPKPKPKSTPAPTGKSRE